MSESQQSQSPPQQGESLSVAATEEEEEEKMMSEQAYSWQPPAMRFDVAPYRAYHFCRQFRSPGNPNNFLKGVKWSPDGSCFVTSCEDTTLRVFHLAGYGSSYQSDSFSEDPDEDSYAASLVMTEGESLYDFCWYPFMSASDTTSCVFATTTRDHPIHLWDSTTGELRCTYRAYDAMDEITAAFSVAFNPSATKIFAGYNNSLRVFDLHRPGRDFMQHSTLEGNKEGQSGIISALAFSPSHNGMLATGSYDQSVAIYREDNMELLYLLHGQEGGITHAQFSKDGNYLYTGARKDPYILCWDVRNTVEVVYKLYRSTEYTNQRILFDIEPYGRHLATGGQDGLVHVYDLQTGHWTSSFPAASDTVNGFSFHPFLPMAASSSGQRRFANPDGIEEDFSLRSSENCASVWSFNCTQLTGDDCGLALEDLNVNIDEMNA